jgi:hypothetical protein
VLAGGCAYVGVSSGVFSVVYAIYAYINYVYFIRFDYITTYREYMRILYTCVGAILYTTIIHNSTYGFKNLKILKNVIERWI